LNENTTLVFPASDLTANDSAGPGESGQVLTVTAVSGGVNTHGAVSLSNGMVTYAPDTNFFGSASFSYTVCDNGTTAGAPDIKCASGIVNLSVAFVDSTPPVLTVPADISVFATSPAGAVVTFSVSAVDDVDGSTPVTCVPASGSTFPVGTTTVNCSSTDAHGNRGTGSFAVTALTPQLTALGPAQLWVGLKNSDDVGTRFDLLAEVLRNGSVVGSGQVNNVPGGSSGFKSAVLDAVNLALAGPVPVYPGDAIGLRLSVRISAASGHRSGTARLWFADSAANSRFTATIKG